MKRKRLTKGSYRKYEAVLDKLARYFPDLEIGDFEPPVGTQRIEEFMDAIERAKARDPHRETFTTDQFRAIVASQDDLRDRIVLRLMLTHALRKGSVRTVQFKHFDHVWKTITVFAKGGTVRTLPLPDPAFWHTSSG
jgi:integrase